MIAHQSRRKVGILIAHRCKQARVLLHVPFTKPVEPVHARTAFDHQRDERLDHRAQHLVVRGIGEQHVERRRGLDDGVDVATPEPCLLLGQGGGHRRQILVRSSPCGQPRDLDLDDQARLDELVRHATFERRCDRRRLAVRGRLVRHEDALAVADLDDPEHCQAVERLAHGRAADAELFRQLALRRNPRSDRQVSDAREELIGNGLGELSPRRQGEAELGIGLEHSCRIMQASARGAHGSPVIG